MQYFVGAIDRAYTSTQAYVVTKINKVLQRLLINPVPALQKLRGKETDLYSRSQDMSLWVAVAYGADRHSYAGFHSSTQ